MFIKRRVITLVLLTMEVSMVPSQFLNVVLEEDNVSSSEEEDYEASNQHNKWWVKLKVLWKLISGLWVFGKY